ncbi:MAG: guanylate kinase, partial [Dehalococcoidia bacterium]
MNEENQYFSGTSKKPLLLILSGLSGVGKDTILIKLEQSGFPPRHITTVTTRQKRPNETDGEHYHFISGDEFREMIANNELLEHATVYGKEYGVPAEPVRKALDAGQDVIIKVDVQGAVTIKKIIPEAVFIFLMPSSMEELVARLKQRHTESAEDLELRIKTAEAEIKHLPVFDYIVLNQKGEVNRAVADIKAIYRAE